MRPLDMSTLILSPGYHEEGWKRGEFCLMEAIAYRYDEPWTDHPKCVDPFYRDIAARINDQLGSHRRQELKKLIPHLATTGQDGKNMQRRNTLVCIVLANLADMLTTTGDHANAESLEEYSYTYKTEDDLAWRDLHRELTQISDFTEDKYQQLTAQWEASEYAPIEKHAREAVGALARFLESVRRTLSCAPTTIGSLYVQSFYYKRLTDEYMGFLDVAPQNATLEDEQRYWWNLPTLHSDDSDDPDAVEALTNFENLLKAESEQ